MGSLEIQIERTADRIVVRLIGEFDISGIREFHKALADLEKTTSMVCIDLRGLSFMGASGLRSLLDIELRSRRDGFNLVVIKGPTLVHRVFEMTGVDQRLVMLEDPAEGNGREPAL